VEKHNIKSRKLAHPNSWAKAVFTHACVITLGNSSHYLLWAVTFIPNMKRILSNVNWAMHS